MKMYRGVEVSFTSWLIYPWGNGLTVFTVKEDGWASEPAWML
jgi:hypothetical protein